MAIKHLSPRSNKKIQQYYLEKIEKFNSEKWLKRVYYFINLNMKYLNTFNESKALNFSFDFAEYEEMFNRMKITEQDLEIDYIKTKSHYKGLQKVYGANELFDDFYIELYFAGIEHLIYVYEEDENFKEAFDNIKLKDDGNKTFITKK